MGSPVPSSLSCWLLSDQALSKLATLGLMAPASL